MKKVTICLYIMFLICGALYSANQVVTNNNDSGAGSLRQAIANVGNGEEITFELSAGNETITLSSQLSVDNSMTIDGDNSSGSETDIIVDGNSSARVFYISNGTTVTLENLTIQNGNTSGTSEDGAGIWNFGTLTIRDCTISGNTATDYGGGICNENGAITFEGTNVFTGNWASFGGEAIQINSGSLSLGEGSVLYMAEAIPLYYNNGNFTANNCTVVYNGGTTQILDCNITFDNLELTSGTALRAYPGKTVTVSGETSGDGTVSNTSGSIFSYNGVNQNVFSGEYATLALSGTSSTKTFADGITTIANEIYLTDTITLTGSSADNVTVQVTTPGTSTYRVFSNNSSVGKTINLSNMTIKGGDISGQTGENAYGGSIYVRSSVLNISNCTITGSKAAYGGAILQYDGILTLTNSTISNCFATAKGGAIRGYVSGITMTGSTISGNECSTYGGGVSFFAPGEMLTINNSTIFGNEQTSTTSPYGGGGIAMEGDAEITNTTIIGNNGNYGGGLYFYDGNLTVKNNIIANNGDSGGGPDYYYRSGTLTNNGYNIVEYSNVAANAIGGFNHTADILYNTKYNVSGTGFSSWTRNAGELYRSLDISSTLALNNNPYGTYTLTFTDGSSLGIDDGTGSDPDQRGAAVYNGTKDIGAYEWEGSPGTLPVELSAFTAQYIENTPTIHWSTQSETDNMGWFIYRNNENDFSTSEVISDMIEGHGTTTQQQFYTYEDNLQNAQVGDRYYYWLESIDYSGIINHYNKVAILTIPEHNDPGNNGVTEPERFGLFQNEPNPVLSSTRISFNLHETAQVDLAIYNLKGQLVKRLYSGVTSKHTVVWDGKDDQGKELKNGVYLYRLLINDRTEETKQLILMR